MLVGYVSDERFSAIAGAQLEFTSADGQAYQTQSSASGAVYADLPAGTYKVTLSCPGFGAKRTTAKISPGAQPHQFRLLKDGLLGYVWPKWVRGGEKSEFRVHSVEGYRLSLWRYGLQKEEVRFLGWYDEHAPRATMQTLPDGDFTQTGVEWNKRGYPANFPGQQLVSPERSGLYYFHAETDSGAFFSFPWIVAPATPQAQIAVLASSNTWNVYNNFGGRSNYINSTSLPATPTVNSRQDLTRYTGEITSVWQFANEEYAPLSFDRPEPYNHIPKNVDIMDPIRGRQAGHLAEAEWRLLGWLEREEFAYDFYSDHQLHTGELNLDAYKILIISTHPEYWSREQYTRVKDWVVNRGGRLMYLGGNGIDCEIEFLDDATMKCLTHYPSAKPGDPITNPETGEVTECRFQITTGESPASLMGVVFTEPGIGTGAPYRVTDENHWIYKGTGLKQGDIFGKESLHERSPGGASGHETDKRSPSTPAQTEFMAVGMNVDDGGAEIATLTWPGGGEVFSAGSITWTSSIIVDKHISTITRNVIERFLK